MGFVVCTWLSTLTFLFSRFIVLPLILYPSPRLHRTPVPHHQAPLSFVPLFLLTLPLLLSCPVSGCWSPPQSYSFLLHTLAVTVSLYPQSQHTRHVSHQLQFWHSGFLLPSMSPVRMNCDGYRKRQN
uniref:Uncharacterized protein n=1 Tax=Mus musculus TaxID=10090 RepID=Q8BQT8_MOUSE|nr:unnamed protein product [Mus musculus]